MISIPYSPPYVFLIIPHICLLHYIALKIIDYGQLIAGDTKSAVVFQAVASERFGKRCSIQLVGCVGHETPNRFFSM